MRLSIAAALLVFVASAPASGTVFHSKESALELAFPGADSVSVVDLFLSEGEKKQIEEEAKVPVDSRLVTSYRGYRDGELLGYAFFDTHNVRTLPETILLVVAPDGTTEAVHVLAFHEPPEYFPSNAWREQFEGRELNDDLWLERGIAGNAGSTLSARTMTAAVRRLLAVHRIKIGAQHEITSAAGLESANGQAAAP